MVSGGEIHPIELTNGQYVGPERVWKIGEDYPGIAMTRSFGDQNAKKVGVSWEPDIKKYEIHEEDRFILIASDGIWDVLTNKIC